MLSMESKPISSAPNKNIKWQIIGLVGLVQVVDLHNVCDWKFSLGKKGKCNGVGSSACPVTHTPSPPATWSMPQSKSRALPPPAAPPNSPTKCVDPSSSLAPHPSAVSRRNVRPSSSSGENLGTSRAVGSGRSRRSKAE
eukprot:scaffold6299_cov176-Amphora_coffeaeformis.AAC.2